MGLASIDGTGDRMRLGEQVGILEKEFKDLTTLWDRFFGGDIRVPPVRARDHLQRRLRLLTERPGVARRSDSFRLEQLQHRFMTYNQNWVRLLREREEGRSQSGRPVRGQGQIPPPPNARPPASVKSASESLFERFSDAKAGLGQKMGMDREAFENKIKAQRTAIEAKLGTSVRFDVLVEDGRVKLAAKKIRKTE